MEKLNSTMLCIIKSPSMYVCVSVCVLCILIFAYLFISLQQATGVFLGVKYACVRIMIFMLLKESEEENLFIFRLLNYYEEFTIFFFAHLLFRNLCLYVFGYLCAVLS